MARAVESLALALAIMASGCGSVASIRPLYTDDDLKAPITEPRIEGEWVSLSLNTDDPAEKPSHHWRVAPRPDLGYYSVEVAPVNDDTNDEVYVFDVRLVRMADAMFFDAELNVHREGGAEGRGRVASFLVPTHVVGSIWIEQDWVRISVLNATWLKEHSTEDLWISFSNRFEEDDLLITGSTEELRSFLVRHADSPEAFYPIYLCRPGAECKPRIIEDLVARSPNDDEALEYAAECFAASGDRERVILLRRRLVDMEPGKPESHASLAEAYLLNRDFAAARREYAAERALRVADTDDPRIPASWAAADIAWSYFLEGAYAEVVSTASYRASGPLASADPLLLSYFSLIRLGRPKEADALLTDATATFVGPSGDQLLLLDTRDRLPELAAPGGERGAFFRGLRELAAGRPDQARHHFSAAHPERHDSRIGLAARIEIERLDRHPPSGLVLGIRDSHGRGDSSRLLALVCGLQFLRDQ